MKNYKIAVAGTGYVGLSLGVLLSQHHQVVAVDIVQAKVDMINNKKSPIQDDYIEKYLAEKDLNLTATLDAKVASIRPTGKATFRLWPYQLRGGTMGKKLQKYLDEAEKTEQQIAELEERLRTIRAAQKKEEDSEIIRAIRSTKMGGRELLALLDNIQAGNVTFLTAVNNASEEAETEEAIEKDVRSKKHSSIE